MYVLTILHLSGEKQPRKLHRSLMKSLRMLKGLYNEATYTIAVVGMEKGKRSLSFNILRNEDQRIMATVAFDYQGVQVRKL